MTRTIATVLLAALTALALASPAQAAERLELRVEGMVCPFCEATVERILGSQPGVIEADASFLTGTAVVLYDPARNDATRIAGAVNARTLYRARPLGAGESFVKPGGTPWALYGLGLMLVVGGVVGVVMWQRRKSPARVEPS